MISLLANIFRTSPRLLYGRAVEKTGKDIETKRNGTESSVKQQRHVDSKPIKKREVKQGERWNKEINKRNIIMWNDYRESERESERGEQRERGRGGRADRTDVTKRECSRDVTRARIITDVKSRRRLKKRL